MDAAVVEFKMSRVCGVISTVYNLTDKALILEKEMGLELIYTLLSMGEKISSLASSLNLSIFEMKYILKRTPDHRKQYMNAMTTNLAEKSVKKLDSFSESNYMCTEQSAAARHHSVILDKSLKILNSDNNKSGSGNVVVTNNIVVRHKDDIPELPNELKNVIEGEHASTDT